MSIEFGPLLVVLLGVPLAAAALGTFLAARSAHRTGLRIIGSVLAILGFATSAALWIWFDRGCYETWQPCGKAPGVALWLLWSGMALAVVIAALSSLYLHFSARRNRNG
jgi:hypothetical protein